jgi:hypothetical protein
MGRFEDSVEAKEIVYDLKSQLKTINFNPDLKKYVENLEIMINELSSLEVDARRTGNNKKVVEYAEKVDEAISYLENLILIAKLM